MVRGILGTGVCMVRGDPGHWCLHGEGDLRGVVGGRVGGDSGPLVCPPWRSQMKRVVTESRVPGSVCWLTIDITH